MTLSRSFTLLPFFLLCTILLLRSTTLAQPLLPASPIPQEFQPQETDSEEMSGPTPDVGTPTTTGVTGSSDADATPVAGTIEQDTDGAIGGFAPGATPDAGEDASAGVTPIPVIAPVASPAVTPGAAIGAVTGGDDDAQATDGAAPTDEASGNTGASSAPGLGMGATPDATDLETPTPDETDGAFEDTLGDPTETSEDDGDDVCFPGSAVVDVEGGVKKTMKDLNVGDRVLVGSGLYSEVFMFTHKDAQTVHKFVSVETESGKSVRMTESHYVPLASGELVAAGALKRGDVLTLGDGKTSKIISLKSVKDVGLFNPQTLHGNIVVNGVVASTYTRSVEPKLASSLLAPLRAAYSYLGYSTTLLENGSSFLASMVPSGKARVN